MSSTIFLVFVSLSIETLNFVASDFHWLSRLYIKLINVTGQLVHPKGKRKLAFLVKCIVLGR
jgi:hypothetical protein